MIVAETDTIAPIGPAQRVVVASQRVSLIAAEAVTMVLTRAARTTTTWCVSRSNSYIDTRHFKKIKHFRFVR